MTRRNYAKSAERQNTSLERVEMKQLSGGLFPAIPLFYRLPEHIRSFRDITDPTYVRESANSVNEN